MLPFPMTLNDLERLSKISHNTEPRGLDLSATDRLMVKKLFIQSERTKDH